MFLVRGYDAGFLSSMKGDFIEEFFGVLEIRFYERNSNTIATAFGAIMKYMHAVSIDN